MEQTFVRRLANSSKENKRGQLVKDISEEECVLILDDEEQQQPGYELQTQQQQQAIKLFEEEYQGEDFSQYLPEPIELSDNSSSQRFKRHPTSKLIKRQSSSSTTRDIKSTAADTSKTSTESSSGISRPRRTMLQFINHIGNNLLTKKRANKISCASGIHSLSFSDTKIGNVVDASETLHHVQGTTNAIESESQCTNASFTTGNESSYWTVTSRSSHHGSNFTLVSRQSQTMASNASMIDSENAPPFSSTDQLRAEEYYAPGNAEKLVEVDERRCKEKNGKRAKSSAWKKFLSTFQKGMEHRSHAKGNISEKTKAH